MNNTASAISSITTGPRQTNMELLRILAMFLILTVHADYWALGLPTASECIQNPASSLTRMFIESIAILSVNVFVLISGWFSIKPSVKGFGNFIFQCAFFFIGIYAVMILAGLQTLSFQGIKVALLLTPKNWFVKAYIGLYILAPVLNYYSENAPRKQFRTLLICFFTFQTIYGCTGAAAFIASGYSTFSFIGLYLLARYLKIYKPGICKLGGVLLCLSIAVNTAAEFFLTYNSIEFFVHWGIFNYINPLVILGATGLLLMFSSMKVPHSRFINWIAASSFAVFLVHCNPNIGTPYFKPLIQQLYSQFDGPLCILVIGIVLVLIFLGSVLLDQPRKWMWKYIVKIAHL